MLAKDRESVKLLYDFVRPFGFEYATGTLIVACRNFLITFLTAYLNGSIVASVVDGSYDGLTDSVLLFGLMLAAFCIIDAIGLYMQSTAIDAIGSSVRAKVLIRIQKAPLFEVESLGRRGEVVMRVNQDVSRVVSILSKGVMLPLMYLVSGVGATVVIALIEWRLCVSIYVLGGILLLAQMAAARTKRRITEEHQNLYSDSVEWLVYTAEASRDVKAQGLANRISDAEDFVFRRLSDCDVKLAGVDSFSRIISLIASFSGFTFFILIGIALCEVGVLSISAVVMVAQLSGLILKMVVSFSESYLSLQDSLAGMEKIREYLSLDEECRINEPRSTPFPSGENDILFEVRDAGCVLNDGAELFSGLSLNIPANTVTALTGENGAGKTTLIKVFLRLYRYNAGSIRFCSSELSDIGYETIRRCCYYVPQDAVILQGTIRENLLMGNFHLKLSDKEMVDALSFSGLGGWFGSQKYGLDTNLVEGGTELSGGQKQMLSIARAILSDCRILILDESFSQISQAEAQKILKGIIEKVPNVILVTHDCSLVELCDFEVSL